MKKILSLLLFFISVCSFNNSFAQETTKVNTTIIIYGSEECHHCIDTKAFLKENNIAFVFYDIDKNPEALQEMLGKLRSKNISTSNLGIPVVDKNGELFSNNGNFEEFLQKLK